MDTWRNLAILAGRIFIAAIFIYDATLLARFPDDNVAFMESFGVPGFLLWPTAIFQFACGLCSWWASSRGLSLLPSAAFAYSPRSSSPHFL